MSSLCSLETIGRRTRESHCSTLKLENLFSFFQWSNVASYTKAEYAKFWYTVYIFCLKRTPLGYLLISISVLLIHQIFFLQKAKNRSIEYATEIALLTRDDREEKGDALREEILLKMRNVHNFEEKLIKVRCSEQTNRSF